MILDKKIALILITGICVCYIHTIIAFFWPEIKKIEYNLWISKDYNERITVAFYMYEIENILCWSIWFYGFSLCAKMHSKRLHKAIFLFCVYFLIQMSFYILDRNTTVHRNLIADFILILSIFIIFTRRKGLHPV